MLMPLSAAWAGVAAAASAATAISPAMIPRIAARVESRWPASVLRVRRRAVLSLLVIVCALAGAWAAPRLAGPASYQTDVASLRFQLAISTPSERGVSLYVPIANWGLRAPVFAAPMQVSIEPRAVDRDGVARAVTGNGA